MAKLIALLTDFGLSDNYVGIMKAVIASISPDSRIIDITHEVLPQNIEQAAYLLSSSYSFFPIDTIFICVVDPSVGTTRKPVAVKASGRYFIAPDNGLLSSLVDQNLIDEAVVLDRTEYRLSDVSNTFHGRDIFAPAGAYLSKGVSFSQLGTNIEPSTLVKKNLFTNETSKDGSIKGRVVHIDRFGNIVTSFSRKDVNVEKKWRFIIDEHYIDDVMATFSDVESGQSLAFIGSTGFLEIGVRNSSAAARYKAKIGMTLQAAFF